MLEVISLIHTDAPSPISMTFARAMTLSSSYHLSIGRIGANRTSCTTRDESGGIVARRVLDVSTEGGRETFLGQASEEIHGLVVLHATGPKKTSASVAVADLERTHKRKYAYFRPQVGWWYHLPFLCGFDFPVFEYESEVAKQINLWSERIIRVLTFQRRRHNLRQLNLESVGDLLIVDSSMLRAEFHFRANLNRSGSRKDWKIDNGTPNLIRK